MPTINIRCNLASAIFPFYTEAHGMTVVDPKMDENFDRYNAANTTPDKGVPQVYYMENVMPISNGYQSIAYNQLLGAGPGGATGITEIFPLFTPDDAKVLFAPNGGQNWVYDAEVGAWAQSLVIPTGSLAPGYIVTYAFINNQTYFFYSNYGCYKYDNVQRKIVSVPIPALTISKIGGICAASGYLITWSGTTVNWSSLVNPLDFVPSIDTGAGGGTVQYCKGNIQFCLPIVGGFLIYCENNIVQAQSTNNINYPFVFREAVNSGGVTDPSLVAWQPNLDTHIAYTSNGLQAINLSNCESVMPEVGDFLASQLWEVHSTTAVSYPNGQTLADIFTQSYLTTQAAVKVAGSQGRYIVVSIGQPVTPPAVQTFQYAIVFDTVLNRYGRLAINHTRAFDYIQPNLYTGTTYGKLLSIPGDTYGALLAAPTTYAQLLADTIGTPLQKQQLAFTDGSGNISVVDFSLGNGNGLGIFLLGKYVMDRNSVFIHNTTQVESIDPAFQAGFTFAVVPSFDEKTLAPSRNGVLLPGIAGARTLRYGLRYTATSMSFLFKGTFHLTSVVLEFQAGGFR